MAPNEKKNMCKYGLKKIIRDLYWKEKCSTVLLVIVEQKFAKIPPPNKI